MNVWPAALASSPAHLGSLPMRDGFAALLLLGGVVLLVLAAYCLCRIPAAFLGTPER
ncbi:MAG: hypothetical protein HY922_10010 [Elusimicrobia bacterium]|nr:hypothetical protein [Elusimicrobiota bacterium]